MPSGRFWARILRPFLLITGFSGFGKAVATTAQFRVECKRETELIRRVEAARGVTEPLANIVEGADTIAYREVARNADFHETLNGRGLAKTSAGLVRAAHQPQCQLVQGSCVISQ